MSMKDRAEYFYSQQKMHLVFGLMTLALIATLAWVVYADWAREWKQYQIAYRELDIQRTQEELKVAEQRDREAIAKAEAAVADAQEIISEREEQIEELQGQLAELQAQTDRARMNFQIQKADSDEVKYKFEHLESEPGSETRERTVAQLEELKQKVAEEAAKTDETYEIYMASEMAVTNAKAKLAELTSELDAASQEMKLARFDVDRLQRKMLSVQPNLVNDAFRNLPVLDFINPSLRINQVMISGIRDNLHFADVGKIDRCHTCHVSIDKPGFEDAPQPLTTHPNLDMYVSDESPHPLRLYGCTVCHEGNGLATEFNRAAHTPRDYHQEHEWTEEYGYHKLHHWDYPMLRKGNEQASCVKCHENPEEIPEANVLLKGHNLFLQNGCYACHSIEKEPYANLRNPGPALTHIAEKLTPNFMAKWIADPWSFRPDTHMPRLFGNESNAHPEGRAREAVLVEAVSRYLTEMSTDRDLKPVPAEPGDAARGRELVRTVGCMACHSIDDIGDDFVADDNYYESNFGPELSNVGSKVNRRWLFNWLLDPAKMWPETKMPSMRLSDGEANDIAAYLLTLRDDDYLAEPMPPVDDSVVDQLIVEDWASRMPESEARERLAAMPGDEKMSYLGKRVVSLKNCYSCHDIPGFEDANPVVIAFTEQGSKDMTQLNWGFVPYYHPTDEQVEIAHHNHAPLNGVHQYEHTKGERFLQEKPNPEALTGAATLRHPELYGNEYVPYPTDADNSDPRPDDTFVPKYRFQYFFNQIKNPALWDRGVVKPFWERQRMGQFGLTDDEAHALALFVSAQVHSIIREEYRDTLGDPHKKAIAEGRAVLKDNNCFACHTVGLYEDMIDIVLEDPNSTDERYFEGATASVDLLRQRVWAAHDIYGVEEIWDDDGNPTGEFYDEAKKVFAKNQWLTGDVYDAVADETVPVSSYAGYFYLDRAPLPVLGLYEGWIRQYYSQINQAPPMLWRQGEKTDYEWLFGWLNNVHTIRPGLDVRMPQYKFTDEEATKIVAMLAALNGETFPFADRETPEITPEKLDLGQQVFAELILCNQCHPAGSQLPTGEDVSAWGPNLALVKDRFQSDWLTDWLVNPQAIYPGTAMPNNFFLHQQGELQPLLGDEEQMYGYIEAIKAWMYNLDSREAILDYPQIRADIAQRVAERAAAEAAAAAAAGEDSYE